MGEHGLGNRNERGERLIEFCSKYSLVLANTLFQHHPRRIYTWKMPEDRGRFQIGYILVKQRFRNQLKHCKSYPGAGISSDHNLIAMKCQLKFKKLIKKDGPRKNWDLSKLKIRETQKLFENVMNKKLEEKTPTNNKEDEIEQEWNELKNLYFAKNGMN